MPKFIIIDADGENQCPGDQPFNSRTEAQEELAAIENNCDDLSLPLTIVEVPAKSEQELIETEQKVAAMFKSLSQIRMAINAAASQCGGIESVQTELGKAMAATKAAILALHETPANGR